MARAAFFDSYNKQHKYDVNRLVNSANMFYLLPRAKKENLDEDTNAIISECREMIKQLRDCKIKSSIMGALGRAGEGSLKDIIMQRADVVQANLGVDLYKIEGVISRAVKCRNYYVHGGRRTVDPAQNSRLVWFLTETLEFLFITSELIDCGLDMARYSEMPINRNHPLNLYLRNYVAEVKRMFDKDYDDASANN